MCGIAGQFNFERREPVDPETLRRMTEWIKHWSWVHTQNEEQKCARERMALFPANAETLFVAPNIWVVSKPSLIPPSVVVGVKRITFFFVNSLACTFSRWYG